MIAVPISADVSVCLSNLRKGLGHLHSIWLKVSLTQLQVVLEQRQSLHTHKQTKE